MSLLIKKPVTKAKIEKALQQFNKTSENAKPSLKDFFGSLKRGIDPMEYQKTVRNEWD